MKKLSIVTTTYKSEKYLKAYFENITNLDGFANFEIVLVLNDPNNTELAIVDEYKNKFPNNFKIQQVPRETIATSTNRGLNLAETEYITLADVDDIKVKDCYLRQMATLEKNPSANYTYGDFTIVPMQGVFNGLKVKTREFNKFIATRCSIVGPNHFFRKSILEKTGMWDEGLKSGGDFDFQVRAAFNCDFKKTGGGNLLYYTRYEGSGSASSGALQQIERTVIELRYGIYDKIDYSFLPKALEYDIYHAHYQGQKKNISELVPNYKELMDERYKKYFKKGLRRNFVKSKTLQKLGLGIKFLFKDPVWTYKKVKSKLKK